MTNPAVETIKNSLNAYGKVTEVISGEELAPTGKSAPATRWRWAVQNDDFVASVTLEDRPRGQAQLIIDFPLTKPLTEAQLKNSATDLLVLSGNVKNGHLGLSRGNRLSLSYCFNFMSIDPTGVAEFLEGPMKIADVPALRKSLSKQYGLDTEVMTDKLVMYDLGEPVKLTDAEMQMFTAGGKFGASACMRVTNVSSS